MHFTNPFTANASCYGEGEKRIIYIKQSLSLQHTCCNTYVYIPIRIYIIIFKLVARRRGNGVGRLPVGLCRARPRQKNNTHP